MDIFGDLVAEGWLSVPAPVQAVSTDECGCGTRLGEVSAALHERIESLERNHMSALKNLSDQVIALAEVATGVVHPALNDLASRRTGVPEADVQAQADVVAKIIAGLRASTVAAMTTAGQSAPAAASTPAVSAPVAQAAPVVATPSPAPTALPTVVAGSAAAMAGPPTTPHAASTGPRLTPPAPPSLDRG